jgi:hypothetical protein
MARDFQNEKNICDLLDFRPVEKLITNNIEIQKDTFKNILTISKDFNEFKTLFLKYLDTQIDVKDNSKTKIVTTLYFKDEIDRGP